jgi:chemotaxis protein CheX
LNQNLKREEVGVKNVQNEAMSRLDLAVSEVFETMLERSCDPMEGEVDTVEGRIVARARRRRR